MTGINGIAATGMNISAAADVTLKNARLLPSMLSDKLNAAGNLSAAGKLNGDYTSGFEKAFSHKSDTKALPQGAAHNTSSASVRAPTAAENQTIDKTSVLYEKALELESYFIKIMLSSMRGTLSGTSAYGTEKSYAQKMYEDMMFDELAVSVTKNAGFGLADQVYLELTSKTQTEKSE
ncbi:rod-binding protein [Treponema lecithinolyticum]|jgi:flagellar protein, putative|uniref:rod-binding protein n=1 Tax=Treponema lecithinolyticum TaxID=53418 RepID=UPI0028F05AD3|nr:rod-binding protein [Treponema lecithinolyticum]